MVQKYIRQATSDDSEQILNIYAEYIKNTVYTFEIDVPSKDEFTQRVKGISDYYPYLLYIEDDKIIGYAYASKHRERAAYYYDVDVSVYIDQNYCGKGIGSKLYSILFELLEHQGFYNAFAGITLPNERSEGIHKKYLFHDIGIFKKAGFKFNNWHDVKWMQKTLKKHDKNPKEILPIYDLLNKENNTGYWEV